jgi:hypothetical protein
MSLSLPSLQHDCSACSGLCCVVLPFDAEQGFGFDKPAHTPCRHLQDDFGCGIHQDLQAHGFRGCIHYSCHGAGQRVTRLFGESNWHSDAAKAGEIYAVFTRMQKLHALQQLVELARTKVGNEHWQQRLHDEQQRLEQLCRQAELQNAVEVEVVAAETHALLRQLATEPAIVVLRSSQTGRG